MNGVREPAPPLFWHEGMLLAPQHFQQLSLRHEQLALYLASAATPFCWGLTAQLRLDVDVLPTGFVRVQELEAVMPDGLVVRHLIDRDPPLEINLSEYREDAGRLPVTVHLAVPAGRSVSGSEGELPRFDVIEAPEVQDEAGGAEPITLQRLRPRLSLEVTTGPRQRPPAKFVSMPILRVGHDGRIFHIADYLPPMLNVPERVPLARQIQDLARRAREKAHHMSRRGGAESRSEIEGLAVGLPPLEVMVATGRSHPYALYLELCRFAGLLTALSTGTVPPVPPRYDHDDPLPGFAEILAVLDQSLDRLGRALIAIRFTPETDRFSLQLEPEWTQSQLLVAVRAAPGMAESAAASWMESALIATRDRVQELWNLRVRGAQRRPIDAQAELDLTLPRGAVLFSVEPDSAFITGGEVLEILDAQARAGELRPTEVLLYIRGEA